MITFQTIIPVANDRLRLDLFLAAQLDSVELAILDAELKRITLWLLFRLCLCVAQSTISISTIFHKDSGRAAEISYNCNCRNLRSCGLLSCLRCNGRWLLNILSHRNTGTGSQEEGDQEANARRQQAYKYLQSFKQKHQLQTTISSNKLSARRRPSSTIQAHRNAIMCNTFGL